MITLKNVSKTYETKDGTVHALQDVSLTINKGDIFGIIGMSGAGKSTLVRCLNFLERPTSGTVEIEGKDLSALKDVKIQELAAEQVARVREEVAFVVLNGNYALQAGLSVAKDAIKYETADSEAAKTYVNVIAVKEGNENSEKTKALVDVLKSDAIKQYINDTYDGAVIPFN